MSRENPLLLPFCQICGEYKGLGHCKNQACPNSDSNELISSKENTATRINQCCVICEQNRVVTCAQCGQGYCETHSMGVELNQLESLHQRIGTCIECHQVVCEHCWILNPSGNILCLKHLEKERKNSRVH